MKQALQIHHNNANSSVVQLCTGDYCRQLQFQPGPCLL